jgi:hypothetical protein
MTPPTFPCVVPATDTIALRTAETGVRAANHVDANFLILVRQLDIADFPGALETDQLSPVCSDRLFRHLGKISLMLPALPTPLLQLGRTASRRFNPVGDPPETRKSLKLQPYWRR